MKTFDTCLAFVAGCSTMAMIAWSSTDAPMQNPGGASNRSSDAPMIHVCAAEDGVLRLAPLSASCPSNQSSMFLSTASSTQAISNPQRTDDGSQSGDRQSVDPVKLADFERRLRALENAEEHATLSNKVQAPFVVVNREGKRIFSVQENDLGGGGVVTLYNGSEKNVAQLIARDDGGYFVGRSATANLVAAIGAFADRAGLRVLEGDSARVDLGRDPEHGTYRLKISSRGGVTVAGLGEATSPSAAGGGVAIVAAASGRTMATMGVRDGKGEVVIYNASGAIPVAALTEGKTAGGLLTIANSKSERMVVAGVEPEGFGVVRAGPFPFNQSPLLGLPGSYIAGKAKK